MFPTADRLAALQDDLGRDLTAFAPELILCAAVVGLLLARCFTRAHLIPLATAAAAAALALSAIQLVAGSGGEVFAGLLALDPFAAYLRTFLLAFLVLALILSRITGIPDAADSADYAVLLLGGTLGMMLMASANHLLMIFLAIEMASLPGYALAGFLKGKPKGSEAALKYVVYGAAASGVMLYGMTLLAGRFGTGSLPEVAKAIAATLGRDGFDLPLAIGVTLTLVGFAFKLAAVPFHAWLPDVVEGAAAEVGAVLTVASKAAAVAVFVRFTLVIQHAVGDADPLILPRTVGVAVAVAAALSATVGNLAALNQTNLKRMLAYSTVAHAGYMLMPLAALRPAAAAAILYYLAAYLLMNLGAFAAVAVVRNRTGAEDLDAVRGLVRRSPAVGVALCIFLFGLLGLPPLAGFAAKFQAFYAVYEAGTAFPGWLGTLFFSLFGVGVVNTVISAGFYLKVLRAVALDDAPADEKGEPLPLGESPSAAAYVVLLAGLSVVVGLVWNPLTAAAARAVVPFIR